VRLQTVTGLVPVEDVRLADAHGHVWIRPPQGVSDEACYRQGKDRPGSPVSDNGPFPLKGLVWELNYRAELDSLHQAEREAQSRELTAEDGWVHFLHGWSQVIAEVFCLEPNPELFARLDEAASVTR
jgi:hypothetical protein